MPRARVLLVDDDASMRRFVAMALEDRDIDLTCAASVQEALAFLGQHGPVQLLITDLMMPGASGADLLRALAGAPALRGSARVVVLSAGLAGTQDGELAGLDVWRSLRKPVSLAELVACVDAALGGAGSGGPVGPGGSAAAPGAGSQPLPALLPAQAQALASHFGGDRGLFVAYHASCLREFPNDIARGEIAVAACDGPALRRLAHSLKSVLSTLGYEAPSALARRLEDVASASGWDAAAVALWHSLRRALAELSAAEDRGG
jgi:CheY-like chemotaxis protein